jgi:hypothetical protein
MPLFEDRATNDWIISEPVEITEVKPGDYEVKRYSRPEHVANILVVPAPHGHRAMWINGWPMADDHPNVNYYFELIDDFHELGDVPLGQPVLMPPVHDV